MKTIETWFLWLMIYSIIGWVYESTICSIGHRKLINRGFLNGPYCPIYGTGAVLVLLLYILNGTRYKLTDTVTVKFSDGSYCITETYTSRFDGSYQTRAFYDAEGIRAAALQTENGQILSADFSTSGANGKYVYKTVYIADDGYTAAWVYFDENGTMLED